ncbi:MAG: asparaginase [Opitutaceae bacterium]|nr:asparaginase [Opitutaceae bacterium]
MMSSAKPSIRLLATGGTIAGAQNASGGYAAAVMSGDELLAAVPQLANLAQITAEQVAHIGSQDMDESLWLKLAARAQMALDDPAVAGVVVTHGTDTMEETAYFLNLALRTDKPVVLVGAMRPATAISPDGPMNLFNAVAVAAEPAAKNRGVLVVANDEIHFAREVAKTNTTQLGTFKSPNRGLAGRVNRGRIHFFGPTVRAHTMASEFAPLAVAELPRVEIVHAFAGLRRDLIDAAVRLGARGIVIAGVGAGNLSSAALRGCAEAAHAGVAVVRSSLTGGGVVERNIEINDDELGLIVAEELNPQKARVLLMLGLTRTSDPAQLQRFFQIY